MDSTYDSITSNRVKVKSNPSRFEIKTFNYNFLHIFINLFYLSKKNKKKKIIIFKSLVWQRTQQF